jgi:hypothetical protein
VRKVIVFSLVFLFLGGLTYFFLSYEEKYYKLSDTAPPEYVKYLKENNLDVKVEKDGSLWLNEKDKADYVVCCS